MDKAGDLSRCPCQPRAWSRWQKVLFWRGRGLAFAEIVLLWLLILATAVTFRPAAWLMSPYLVWVAFVATLNHSIWRLNV